MSASLVVVGFVAGFVAGSCMLLVGMSKERKRISDSKRELSNGWVELWR